MTNWPSKDLSVFSDTNGISASGSTASAEVVEQCRATDRSLRPKPQPRVRCSAREPGTDVMVRQGCDSSRNLVWPLFQNRLRSQLSSLIIDHAGRMLSVVAATLRVPYSTLLFGEAIVVTLFGASHNMCHARPSARVKLDVVAWRARPRLTRAGPAAAGQGAVNLMSRGVHAFNEILVR